jgi:dipeptidyl aminopeptidase/acylaminoacyl peptidase
MISRRGVLAGGAVAPAVLGAAVAAPAAQIPPTLDELLAPSTLLGAALSPNGTQLAVLRVEHEREQLKAYVLLQHADQPKAAPTVVLIGNYDVQRIEWANDERLLIWVDVHKELDGRPTRVRYGDLYFDVPKSRILSMNLDGSESALLFGQEERLLREFDLATVVDTLSDDPNQVLMQAWDSQKLCYVLYKVDVRTGAATFFERGSQATYGWFTQNGVPVVRFDSNRRGTVVSMFTRAPGAPDWTLYRKLRRDEMRKFSDLEVVGSTPDVGVLLVASERDGDDGKVLRRFDLNKLELGDAVVAKPGRDITGVFIDERSRLIAASFTEDRNDYLFFEPGLKTQFDQLSAVFRNDANVGFIDVSLDHKRFVLSTTNPTDPGSLWFYDAAGSLNLLGQTKPWLNGRLAPMSVLKLKSRDGLDLTAYLTLPISEATGPRPLVVVPHGGPEMRDDYSFDNFVQAFAAKGWAVLQVNFRGSGGYGRAFADAGRKRWGVEMQNDVEDALAAALATGKLDSRRVAICGASYGGYAALMGAVKTPGAYRAVVSIAGVSHLDDFLANARDEDGADSPTYQYWVKTIGDPVADKALLAASSPALRAREIKAPVLLIHGALDSIVPVEQSKTMNRALKAAGASVKYNQIAWIGHRGWDRFTTRNILNQAIEHIAKAFDQA